MTNVEMAIAAFCVIFGIGLQWSSRKKGARDMEILGAMLWFFGLILLMDCKWHFLTEPEH